MRFPPVAQSTAWRDDKLTRLMAVCLVAATTLAGFIAAYGTLQHFEPFGLAATNRTLNQLTAVLLTCVALVVPLTSNLYTPKLVKLYVTHPLIVVGLAVLVLSHLLVIGASYFPPGHPVSQVLVVAVSLVTLLVLSSTLPYLYSISQFLRPGYFLPMLTRRGVQSLRQLQQQRGDDNREYGLFEMIDVITNIALTGMYRGDRQLVLLSLRSLHTLLQETINDGSLIDRPWRGHRPSFVPGLAREGQDYLARERIWPEAYVLAQMLKVMEVASKRQHEILGELASQLVQSAQLSFASRRDAIVELHVMAFNTMLRGAIEEKDLRSFQNLSYHYRLLIEGFHSDAARMNSSAHHLLHYGVMASQQGPVYGLETVIYDVGELVLSVARHSEDGAIALVQHSAGNYFSDYMVPGSPQSRVAWRALIRLYWEARASGMDKVADLLRRDYLHDDQAHREHLRRALRENRELHFEFNDRLMRFAHLSPPAQAQATAFVHG